MKISLVTLSFNQRQYLQEAIESVVGQKYQDLEYIVVDPGSTDGSRDLIGAYAGQISTKIFEPDQGAADGLNKGFSHATGEVLGFLNADDLLLPGSLQLVADFFRQHADIDIVMGNGFIIDGEGRRTRHVRARGFTVRRYLRGGCRWLQQSTFFRKSAFQKSPGFNVANRTCWDGELFVTMASEKARVGYLDRDLSEFRIHGASISGAGTNREKYQQDCLRIFRQIEGRNWRWHDGLSRFLYRIEGAVIDRTPIGKFLAR